jgi:uncharacterized protein (DUF2267 family)
VQTEEFINRVAQSPEVDNPDTARRVTFATIEALCRHLPKEEIRQMTSQLPRELTEAALAGGQQAGDPESRVELDDFYHEVAVRAEMPKENVPGPVRAVINTLGDAISRGEFVDVTFDLPPEINTLLAS